MNKSFNSSKAAAEGSATQAKKLADRLKELAGKSELTASEQAEMSDIINKLNSTYPSLNLKIDEHRIPQDGQFTVLVDGQEIDLNDETETNEE